MTTSFDEHCDALILRLKETGPGDVDDFLAERGLDDEESFQLVQDLENRGLVRREPDPDDGRFTNAILTPDGYAELVKAAPGHVELVRQLVFDPLTETDRRALHRVMAKLLPGLLGDC